MRVASWIGCNMLELGREMRDLRILELLLSFALPRRWDFVGLCQSRQKRVAGWPRNRAITMGSGVPLNCAV